MKNLNRYISIFLICMLLFTALPVSSLADEIESIQMMQFEEIPETSVEEGAEHEIAVIDAPAAEDGEEELEVLEIIEIEETEEELPAETEIPAAEETPAAEDENTPPQDELPEETETPVPEESVQPEETIVPEETPAAEAGDEAVLLETAYYAKLAGESGQILPEDLQVELPAEALPLAEIENLIAETDYILQDNILLLSAAWLSGLEAAEYQLILHGGENKTFILPLVVEEAILVQEEMDALLAGDTFDVSNLYVNGVSLAEQISGEGWKYNLASGILTISAEEGVTVSGSGTIKYIYFDDAGRSYNYVTFDNANINFLEWDHDSFIQGDEYSEVFPNVKSGRVLTITLKGENTLDAEYLTNERFSSYITFRMKITGEGSLKCGRINVKELTINDGAEVAADTAVWSHSMYVANASLSTDYLLLRDQYYARPSGKLTVNSDGTINAGRVEGGHFSLGDGYGTGGTLNIDGTHSEYGLHIAQGLNLQNGGRINVKREADGLNYTAIRNEGNYQQLGGAININLSGASDYTGMYVRPQSVPTAHNGTFTMTANNASSVRGIVFDSSNSFETGVQLDLKFNGTSGDAEGIYAKGAFVAKDTCSITMDGGINQTALTSETLLETRGNADIQLSGAGESAVGLAAPEVVLSGGSLNVDVDWNTPESYAIVTSGDFKLNGGSANLSAARLAPMNVRAVTKNGTAKYMNSSYLTWNGTTLSIPERIEFFINEERKLLFENEPDIGGEGWRYNAAEQTLYLNGFSGKIISFPNHAELTINLAGVNTAQQILCAGEVEFTGDGSLALYENTAGSYSAIDATAVKLASGKLEIAGYTHGISAYDVALSGGSLAVSDCIYGVTTNTLAIGESCSVKLEGSASACKVFQHATLAGAEFSTAGIRSIEISGGEVLGQQLADGLTVGGVTIAESELTHDHSGEGWMWVAEDQQLVLEGYTGGDIVSTSDTLNMHTRKGVSGLTVYANTLNYTADSAVWMRNAHIEAMQLNLKSGSIYLRDGVLHTFDGLNISGGRLNAPGTIEVNQKLKVSGGSLVAGSVYTDELEITGGSVTVTDETRGVYEKDGELALEYTLIAVNCLVKGGELNTVSLPVFGDYKQTGGKAKLCTSAAQQENNMLMGVFVSNAFSASGGSVYINNACETGMAMFATKINLSGKVSGEFFGGGMLFGCDDVKVAGKKIDGYKYRALTMSKGARKSLSIDDKYVMLVGGNYYTAYMANNMNFSGSGWNWNHETKTLTLSGYDSRKTSDIELFVSGAKLHLQGGSENYVSEIYSDKSLTVTGTGKLEASTAAYTGEIRRILSPESITISGCTNINLEILAGKNITVKNSELKYTLLADGNISIAGSTINMPYYGIELGGNLTVKSSVFATKTVYCAKTATVSDSIVFYWDNWTCKKKSFSSNVAVFAYEAQNVDGYPIVYSLPKNATISSSFRIPSGIELMLMENKVLTIKNGKTLYVEHAPAVWEDTGSKIKGNLVVYGTPESMQITGPAEMATGSKHKLDATFAPEGVSAKVRWSLDNPALAQIDNDGNITISANARNAGKKLKVTALAGANDAVSAEHEITILPAVQELVVRQNGREVKSISLWLDPNANKTTQLYVHAEPTGASQAVSWKSTNTKIAAVDEQGVVSAKKAGSAYVYAVAADGSETASPRVKVTVKKAPTSIKFTSGNPILGFDAETGMGTTVQLKYSLSSGSASSVSFTSQDESIATVDENGVVTATGIGKTRITARTYNGKSASCTITVKPAPDRIELNIHELVIGSGDSYGFSAVIPSGTVGAWTYSVSNGNASIDPDDGAFAAGEAGEVYVTATTFNGKTDRCKVTILPAPDAIELSRTAIELGKGESCTLSAKPVLNNGGDTAATLSFASSNKKVATVSSQGKISAKATGTAQITVTAHNGVTAICEVKVCKAPTSVKIAKSATMAYDAEKNLGTQLQLEPVLSSKSASALTWKSSNDAVAAVDANGIITATGVGTAKITVRTFNKKSASCTVTVKPAPASMSFAEQRYIMAVDDRLTVSASANSGSYTPVCSYAVENTAVASVDVNGIITPKIVGETGLAAQAFNGASGETLLRVVEAPTHISLNETSIALKKGKKFTIEPAVSRADGLETAASFSYASSKPKVASVSAAGVVTAKAKGTAVITVSTHNGLQATIQIKVP